MANRIMIGTFLKFYGVGIGMFLGVLATAVLTVQSYMSLPPNNGKDMALGSLFFRCVSFGIPGGVIAGLIFAKLGAELTQKHPVPNEKSAQRRVVLGVGALGILGVVILLFYGHDNSGRLATTMPRIISAAQKQGFSAVWSPLQPNLLVINLAPHGYGRMDDSDNATWYYLAFCRARRSAGYSVVSSVHGTVELHLMGKVIKRKSWLEDES